MVRRNFFSNSEIKLKLSSNEGSTPWKKETVELGTSLMPVILATPETEIRRMEVQSLHETLSQKNKTKQNHKKGLVEWL
jgi:hypothetical protein